MIRYLVFSLLGIPLFSLFYLPIGVAQEQIVLVDDEVFPRVHQQSKRGQSFRFPIQPMQGDVDSLNLLVNQVVIDGAVDELARTQLTALIDKEQAIVLEVQSGAFLRAGTYEVLLYPKEENLDVGPFPLILPFIVAHAELAPIPPLNIEIVKGAPTLVDVHLEEITGGNGLWDLQIANSTWSNELEMYAGIDIAFPRWPEMSLGADSLLTIQIVLGADDASPGAFSTNLVIDSDNLLATVIVPVDIDVRRWLGWLVVALLAGLMVSFLTKIGLDKVQRRAMLRKEGGTLLDEIDALRTEYKDPTLQKALHELRVEIATLMNMRLHEVDAAGESFLMHQQQLDAFMEEFKAELGTLQSYASAFYAVVSGQYALPHALRIEVDEMVRTFEHMQDLLVSGNLAAASQKQDNVKEHLSAAREIGKRIYNSYEKVGVEGLTSLFKADAGLVAGWNTALEALKAPADSSIVDAESLRVLLHKVEAMDRVAYEVYRLITDRWQHDLIQVHVEMQRFSEDSSTILSGDDNVLERDWHLAQQKIASMLGSLKPQNKRLEDILPAMLSGFEKSLIDVKSMLQRIADNLDLHSQDKAYVASSLEENKLLAIVKFLGPAMDEHLDNGHESMGEYDKALPMPLPSITPFQQSEASQVRFPNVKPTQRWASSRDLRRLAWRDERLVRGLQTLAFGLMVAAIGFVTFSTHYIGTWPEFLGAFFWAYAFDFSAGMLSDRIGGFQ